MKNLEINHANVAKFNGLVRVSENEGCCTIFTDESTVSTLRVYRNLRTGGYSIKFKNLVVAVAKDHNLKCGISEFLVSQKGRDNVLAKKQKQVHAYVVTNHLHITACSVDDTKRPHTIRYNPYEMDCFKVNHNRRIHKAYHLLLNNKGMACHSYS